MSKEKSAISVFQRYLTVWVIMCMVIGILIGKFLPQIPDFLNRFEYAKASIPILNLGNGVIADTKSLNNDFAVLIGREASVVSVYSRNSESEAFNLTV